MEKGERRLGGKLKAIRAFIDEQVGHDLHAKRVASLAGATLGPSTSSGDDERVAGSGDDRPFDKLRRPWRKRGVW